MINVAMASKPHADVAGTDGAHVGSPKQATSEQSVAAFCQASLFTPSLHCPASVVGQADAMPTPHASLVSKPKQPRASQSLVGVPAAKQTVKLLGQPVQTVHAPPPAMAFDTGRPIPMISAHKPTTALLFDTRHFISNLLSATAKRRSLPPAPRNPSGVQRTRTRSARKGPVYARPTRISIGNACIGRKTPTEYAISIRPFCEVGTAEPTRTAAVVPKGGTRQYTATTTPSATSRGPRGGA
jgi:hypothetical protein